MDCLLLAGDQHYGFGVSASHRASVTLTLPQFAPSDSTPWAGFGSDEWLRLQPDLYSLSLLPLSVSPRCYSLTEHFFLFLNGAIVRNTFFPPFDQSLIRFIAILPIIFFSLLNTQLTF